MYLILSVHVNRADVNTCLGKEKYALTNNWLNQNQHKVMEPCVVPAEEKSCVFDDI